MTPRRAQILIGLGVLVAVLLVVLVVALIIGWEDPVAAPTSLPTTTSTAEPTTTSSSSSTTTSSTSTTTSSTTTTSTSTTTTTTTTLPPGACAGSGAGPLPAGAAIEDEVGGDFDGDGVGDRLLVYRDATGGRWVRMELSYGHTADVAVASPGDVRIQAVNFGGHGDLAIIDQVRVMPIRSVSLYHLAACSFGVVSLRGGGVADFDVGRDEGGLRGVTCTDDGIVVTGGERLSPVEYEVHSLTYFWDPVAGEFVAGMGAAAILHSPEDDAEIGRHGEFNC